MQTLGEVRVIGDSGALQIAFGNKSKEHLDLQFFLGPLGLIHPAKGLYRQCLGGDVWECELVGSWPPYPHGVIVRHNTMRLAMTNQTSDAVANLVL